MADRNGQGNRAWSGLDFLTINSGINPLVASYEGAPHMLRGTDPADYSRDAAAWWEALNTSAPAPGAATNAIGVMPASWSLTDVLPVEAMKKVGIGVAGVLLALIVVAFGLLVLVKGE